MRKYIIFILIISAVSLFYYKASFAVLVERNIVPLWSQVGARPISLGGSYIGISDDSNAAFFNPGGLARSKGITVAIKDSGNIAAAEAYPTGYGVTLGLGIISTLISDMPYKENTITYRSNILIASYGGRMTFLNEVLWPTDFWDNTDFGINIKTILNQDLREEGEPDRSATGWDMDFGLLWRASDWLKIGFVEKNLLSEGALGGGVMNWNTQEKEDIPAWTKIGFGAKVVGDVKSPIYFENNELIIASDLDMRTMGGDPSLLHLGAEWMWMGTMALRVGMDQHLEDGEVKSKATCGLGTRSGGWGYDLAYSKGRFEGESSIYFSILYWPEEWVFERKPEVPRVEVPGAPPEVKITGPEQDKETYDESVNIWGIVEPGTELYINGNRVFVDPEGKYNVQIPLATGKNLIEIVGIKGGVKTTLTRRILRKAKVVVAEEKEALEKEAKVIKPAEEKIAAEEARLKEEAKKKLAEAERRRIEEERKKLTEEKRKLEEERKKLEKEKKELEEKRKRAEELATLGIIDISPGKEYSVTTKITRGEFVTWLVRAKALPIPKVTKDPFLDVPKDHPLAPYIKAAVDAGVIKGYPDHTFRPNTKVKETEGIEIFKKLGAL